MIITDEYESFILKSILVEDIESLRVWKNKHRGSFFHKNEITSSEQYTWFSEYQNDPENIMFVVIVDGVSIGCMGYRLKDGGVDVYNIMRGEKTSHKPFKMSDAFSVMLSYLKVKYQLTISCVVLNDNPAFNWYLNNNFIVKAKYDNYSLLEYYSGNNMKKYLIKVK
ncbi:hypothetical protein [Marinicellulosiphila megalodicopiae]|uniref:hypothetical protein n=1 Tax=Marinicellulosiphila megalodicopiae TaxID=2724896 RepID=UPI003BB10B2C